MSSFSGRRNNNSPALFYHRFASGMSSPSVMMQGPLLKLGNVNRSFKLRYFVLYKNRTLAWWPSQTEEIYGKDPMGILEMHEVRAVKIVNKPPKIKKNKKVHNDEGDAEDDIGDDIVIDFEKTRYFCFELTTKYRTYLLCCDDALHFNDWIMHLNNAVFGKKLYKGWFTKQGLKAKSWKKRWFVVYDTLEMRYYENEKHSKPKGAIMLTELIEINVVLDNDKYPKHKDVMELITPDRNWILSAPSKDDQKIWYNRLCDLIGKDGKKKCYRLNPIYDNYLSQYDDSTHCWIQRYFALTPNHLYYFESAEECDIAQSMAYFDKARFHIGISKFVSGFIPLNKPTFNIYNMDQCKIYNKQNLFEIDTSFNKIIMSASHNTELEEWQNAFVKIELIQIEDDENDDIKMQNPLILQDAFSEDILKNLKASTSNKNKKKLKPKHSPSNSLNLSMVTHFPGFIKKDKNKKPKMGIIKDDVEEDQDEKDGYNETKLPAPKPRTKTINNNDKYNNDKYNNDKSDDNKNGSMAKTFKIKKIGFGGAGNAGKVDPFKRSKTERNVYQRDRAKSKSLNESMLSELSKLSTASPVKKTEYFGPNSIATSYNPNRHTHYLPSTGPSNLDFKFNNDSFITHSNAINMNGNAYTPHIRSAVGSVTSILSTGNHLNNNNNNNNDQFYTMNRVIPMISPTPSRHSSFDSMANNVHSTRNRPESFLSVTYNTGLRTSVSKSYATDDELSMTSINDQQITKQHSDKLNAMKSMLATEPDTNIVAELMELGFVNKEQCEKAAIATNNRSIEAAQQWLFNNLTDKVIINNRDNKENGGSVVSVGIYSDGYNTQNENGGSCSESEESNYSNLSKGLFDFQINDLKQKQINGNILEDEERNKILELAEASMRAVQYFENNLWNEAIKEYTLSLNEIDADVEAEHPLAYTYYCYRSECYRKLKYLLKAEQDTESWMELRWNRADFDFIKGCDIGSAIYIDLKRYAESKRLIVRGLQINPQNQILQKRLKKLNAVLSLELTEITNEIDRNQLEYDGDEIIIEQEEKDNMRESKENRAMTVISEWDQLIKDKTIKILEKESKKLKQCTTDIGECESVKRIIVILKFYGKWCQTQETATILDRISIYNIIFYLKSYSLYQLMNDYIHIKEGHVDNLRQQRYEIFDYFVATLPECDNLNSCKCFLRNNRNRKEIDQNNDKFKKMYFNFSRKGESHDILTMQILDSIHSYLLHSSQCVMMKLPQQNLNKDTPQNEILSEFLNGPQSALKNANPKWLKLCKFKTNIGDDDDDDDDDDEEEEKEQKEGKEDLTEMNELSIGKSMKYWTYFKKDSDFIKPKYKTLKREMMKNKIFKITEPEWFMCLLKANVFKKTFKGKVWIARGFNDETNDKYGIPEGLPISITHLMVLLFYTNNMDLQYKIRDNLNKSNNKKIHREIANFTKILEEGIRFYGDSNHIFMSSAIFYHGLSSKLLINDFKFSINIPTLITLEPSSAMILCNKYKNMILQFRAATNTMSDCKLLDVSWLSDNPYNNAFITSLSKFDILDIIINYESNEVFINTIVLFKKLVNGYYIEDIIHPKQVYQYIALGLMSNMSEGYMSHSNIPRFMQSVFEYIVNNITSIWIIKSQFEKLGHDLRTCFFDIDQEESITTGPFYDYWSQITTDLTVNLTQEYEWNICKQDDILRFWGLATNQFMEGPQLNYIVFIENDQEINISFIPIIKRSHPESIDNVSIGIKLLDLPDNYDNITIQYNVFCTQLRYTLSNIVEFSYDDDDNQMDECIAFNVNQIKTLNSFHFQISLRVLNLD